MIPLFLLFIATTFAGRTEFSSKFFSFNLSTKPLLMLKFLVMKDGLKFLDQFGLPI